MTGFAREAGSTGPHAWAWEIKSVNGRGLEIRVRVPAGYDAAGESARRHLAATLGRGQCQLGLTLVRAPGVARTRIDTERLRGLIETITAVERPEAIGPATLDGLLAIRGVVEFDDGDAVEPADDATLLADLEAGALRLAQALDGSRRREGEALARTIDGQLDAMAALVDGAEAHPGRTPEAIRARLAAQVEALFDASPRLDPQRLHQEAALLAVRADIREELDRLRAHLAAARELVAAGGPVGRRLDFLAQEFGREANTLCAKANDVELSRIGLDLKAVVEQFREQVQNVE